MFASSQAALKPTNKRLQSILKSPFYSDSWQQMHNSQLNSYHLYSECREFFFFYLDYRKKDVYCARHVTITFLGKGTFKKKLHLVYIHINKSFHSCLFHHLMLHKLFRQNGRDSIHAKQHFAHEHTHVLSMTKTIHEKKQLLACSSCMTGLQDTAVFSPVEART